MSPRPGLLVLILASLTIGPSVASSQRRCPEGMVWGGRKCEWQNVCPDGQPTHNGLCRDGLPPRRPNPSALDQPVQPPAQPERRQPPPIEVERGDPPLARARPCERSTVFHAGQDGRPKVKSGLFGSEVQARRVLLVGGNAAALLRRYLTDAKEHDRTPDLRRLEVVLFDNAGQRKDLVGGDQVRMSVGQMLAGMTWEQVWVEHLRQIESAGRSDASQQAEVLEADLVCGDG